MDDQSLKLELIRICHRPGLNAEQTTYDAQVLFKWVKQKETEGPIKLVPQSKKQT